LLNNKVEKNVDNLSTELIHMVFYFRNFSKIQYYFKLLNFNILYGSFLWVKNLSIVYPQEEIG